MGAFGQQEGEGQVFYRYNAATGQMEEFVPPEPTLLERARNALTNARSTFVLSLTGGKKMVPNVLGRAAMVHVGNGWVYFKPDEETLYEVTEVSWDGPEYAAHTVTYTDESAESRQGNLGTIAGAAIGTAVLPGLGTLIGAAIGSESDDEARRAARRKTREEYEEVPATCRIYLSRAYDHQEILITTKVKGDKAADLLGLVVIGPQDAPMPNPVPVPMPVAVPIPVVAPEMADVPMVSAAGIDPYEELKKAKELLDLGILTPEEFGAMKARLLG